MLKKASCMYFSWFCIYGSVYRLLAECLVTAVLDAWWILCSGVRAKLAWCSVCSALKLDAWWVSCLSDRYRFKASVLRSLGGTLGLIGSFHKLVPVSCPPTSTSLFS